jgi:hypothetical protein
VGRRLVRDESGIALVLALITMLVLASLTSAVLFSVTVNHRNALTSAEGDQAFALAQDGLADAEGRLYTAVKANCSTNCVPSSSFAQDGGTVVYAGSLSGSTWTLTGTGTVGGISRTVSAQANVPPPQVISDPTIWNYLYVDSAASCTTLSGGTTVNVPLYTQGSVCLTGGSHFTGADLEVGGSLSVPDSGSSIGTSSTKITKLDVAGACTQTKSGQNWPCNGNGPTIWASAVGSALSPAGLTMPAINLAGVYATQAAATKSGCPANFFDNDSTLNNSLSSSTLTSTLFPVPWVAPSYDCKVGANEIKWTQAGSGSWNGTLYVNGTFIFDGSLNVVSGQQITYYGGGTIYFTGGVTLSSGAICGGPSGCSNWKPGSYDPTKAANAQCSGCNELILAAGCWANSTGSVTIAPKCGYVTGGSTLQTGSLVNGDFTVDGGTSTQGPIIAKTLSVTGGANISTMIPFQKIPPGTPADTKTVTSTPAAPTNWSG